MSVDDPWGLIVSRARAIWARTSELPLDAASLGDRLDAYDRAAEELIDEGVPIPDRYRGHA